MDANPNRQQRIEEQDDISYYKRVLNKIIYRYKNQHRQSLHFQYLRRLNSKLRPLPCPTGKNEDISAWTVEDCRILKSLVLKSFFFTRQLMAQGFFLHYCTSVIALLASLWKLFNRYGQSTVPQEEQDLNDFDINGNDEIAKDVTSANNLLSAEMDDIPMIPSFSRPRPQ